MPWQLSCEPANTALSRAAPGPEPVSLQDLVGVAVCDAQGTPAGTSLQKRVPAEHMGESLPGSQEEGRNGGCQALVAQGKAPKTVTMKCQGFP